MAVPRRGGIVPVARGEERTEEGNFDVVIVSSGYGGAVAAATLAGATKANGTPATVCVLERGREYLPGGFPSGAAALAGHLRWSVPGAAGSQGKAEGLFDLRLGPDANALLANGLGGGSLIDAGVMLQPDAGTIARLGIGSPDLQACFDDARALLDTPESNTIERHPAHAAGTHPLKFHALKQLANTMPDGSVLSAVPISVAMADGPNSVGVTMGACIQCGDCATGCNHNAKLSLDTNLLVSSNGDMIAVAYDYPAHANAVADERVAPHARCVGPTITARIDTTGAGGSRLCFEELAVPAALRRVFEALSTTAAVIHQTDRIDWSTHAPDGADPCVVSARAIAHSSILAVMGDDGAAGELELVGADTAHNGDGAIVVRWPALLDHPLFDEQIAAIPAARDGTVRARAATAAGGGRRPAGPGNCRGAGRPPARWRAGPCAPDPLPARRHDAAAGGPDPWLQHQRHLVLGSAGQAEPGQPLVAPGPRRLGARTAHQQRRRRSSCWPATRSTATPLPGCSIRRRSTTATSGLMKNCTQAPRCAGCCGNGRRT